jgi:Protein of unknown function (DUF742)
MIPRDSGGEDPAGREAGPTAVVGPAPWDGGRAAEGLHPPDPRPADPRPPDPCPAGPDGLLRPYAMTGGRARPRQAELEIESLVSTTLLGEMAERQVLERRSIALLCRQPQSIAELSALLDLPLGVIRVLVGDMADQGLVRVHGLPGAGHGPDRALLERVLEGLRRI